MNTHKARAVLAATFLVMTGPVGASAPTAVFDAPDAQFTGRVWAAPVSGGANWPGSTLQVGGDGFKPGQRIQFSRGGTPLLPAPLTADDQGRIQGQYTIPADAVPGIHPVVLWTEAPYHAEVLPLKVSRQVDLVEHPGLRTTQAALVPGLYQVAYSAQRQSLYASSALGYPPNERSRLIEIDPDTLTIRREAEVATLPGDAGPAGAYGIGLDESQGNVWVTNTRQDTVAVYAWDDLSLKRQFDKGAVTHPRDVVIDEQRARVYVSQVTVPEIAVFDARTLAPLPSIAIPLAGRDAFSPASLRLDPADGSLYVVSLSTPEVVVIDGPAGKLLRRVPVPGAASAIGLDVDVQGRRIYVAAQNTDNLIVLDLDSGKLVHDVTVGAGALNVVFEPTRGLAYVVSRGAGTVTVVDRQGKIVANVGTSAKANHLVADPKGRVFVIDKSGATQAADRITRLEWTTP